MTDSPLQHTASQHRDDLKLIPPLAEEFWVYGGNDILEHGRAWALDGHYLLAAGIPKCAHGLYLMASCPVNDCRGRFDQLDHANIWVPHHDSLDRRPFILSHPYSKAINAETRTYAEAHGLAAESYPEFGDGWYGSGTIPIRLTVPKNWPLWPIEAKALILLSTQPVAWPADPE